MNQCEAKNAAAKRRAAGATTAATRPPSPRRWDTAFHEAGHAIAMLALYGQAPLVRLLDGPELYGETVLLDPPTRITRGRHRRADKAVDAGEARTAWWVSLAGPAAERRYVGRANPRGYSASDMDYAKFQAAALVPSPRARAIWWRSEWLRVLRFVDSNWAQTTAIARALHERESLLPSEVIAAVAPHPAVRAPAGWFF